LLVGDKMGNGLTQYSSFIADHENRSVYRLMLAPILFLSHIVHQKWFFLTRGKGWKNVICLWYNKPTDGYISFPSI